MLHALRRCLVSVAPVTILVAGCATAAKPGYEITNPYRITAEVFHANTTTIALTRSADVVGLENIDPVLAVFDSLLETSMRQFGFTVVSDDEFDEIAAGGASAYAQQAPVVRVGDRVRVSVAPDEPHRQRSVGTLLAFNTSHLRIALADGTREIEIPRSALTRLEVSRGRPSKWATGLGLGLLGGALIGAAVGLTLLDHLDDELGLTAEDWAAVGAILGAPTGMFFGTLIGASIRADRWEEVSRDRLRVSFAPQRDGRFGLGLSVKF